MYKIHLLPAAYGDSILIEYGSSASKYILIDGGPYYNFDELVHGLKRVAPELRELELLVITHIDIDHIDGIVTMLKKDELPFTVKDIWFNGFEQVQQASGNLGALQGEYITQLISDKELPHNKLFNGRPVMVEDFEALPTISLADGMTLTLLSPGKAALQKLEKEWLDQLKHYGTNLNIAEKLAEDTRYDSAAWLGDETIEELQDAREKADTSVPNRSSIAFIATFDDMSCLFAGDATSDNLLLAIEPMLEAEGVDRLKLDAWKLSHHGSKKSNLEKLMEKIDCSKMLVSSNGAKYHHPNPECIAKLIKFNGPKLKFFFNYKSEHNSRWADENDQTQYEFESVFPDDDNKPGITVVLA
jgi:beta-lactamase superfamily II metal-dependent hydrolase